jgi:hypothetical protein
MPSKARMGAAMTRRTTFEHGGTAVTIEYRPELFADGDFLALLAHVHLTNDLRLSARALAALLVAWSLTGRGRPLPITEGAILGLPFPLHVALIRAIAADGARMKAAAAAGLPPPWMRNPKRRMGGGGRTEGS